MGVTINLERLIRTMNRLGGGGWKWLVHGEDARVDAAHCVVPDRARESIEDDTEGLEKAILRGLTS